MSHPPSISPDEKFIKSPHPSPLKKQNKKFKNNTHVSKYIKFLQTSTVILVCHLNLIMVIDI